MTRYIDADKLKEDILEENSWYLYNEFGSPTQFHELIDKQPTVNVVEVTDKSIKSLIKGLEILGCTDVVEVVRCKDCKYRTELPYVDKDTHEPIYDCGYNISPLWGEENGYCHHGKRRE